MGPCLSLYRDAMTLDAGDPDDWQDWARHPCMRQYRIVEELGEGAFSKVVLAKRKPLLTNGQKCALKIIFLGNPRLTNESKALLRQESAILRKLHHPNVIDVRQTHVWERQQILIIEEELLEGSDVLDAAKDAIKGHGFKMTESFAAQVIKQVLKGVQYIHSRGVLHRDLKPENIRFTRPTQDWVADPAQLKLKLIDFGLSCVLGGAPETGWLGSPGYVAPEVIDNLPHSRAMDVWSVGAILFVLLTGAKAMSHENALALAYAKTEAGGYEGMHGNPRWDAVSAGAQALVLQLLERDPRKRITADSALRNAWLVRASRRWAAGKGQKSPNGSSFLTGMDASASAAGGILRQGSAGEGDQKGAGQEAVERSGSHAIKETDDLAADERIEDVASEDKWQMVLAFLEQCGAQAQGDGQVLDPAAHTKHLTCAVPPRLPGSLADLAKSPQWRALVLRAYAKHRHSAVAAGKMPSMQRGAGNGAAHACVDLPGVQQLHRSASSSARRRSHGGSWHSAQAPRSNAAPVGGGSPGHQTHGGSAPGDREYVAEARQLTFDLARPSVAVGAAHGDDSGHEIAASTSPSARPHPADSDATATVHARASVGEITPQAQTGGADRQTEDNHGGAPKQRSGAVESRTTSGGANLSGGACVHRCAELQRGLRRFEEERVGLSGEYEAVLTELQRRLEAAVSADRAAWRGAVLA